MTATAPDDAILARRRLTNKLIVAHEAARLRPFLDPKVDLIAGDGGLIVGAEAVVRAFEAQFQDPGFITYVRTPETVTVAEDGERAAEAGHWVAARRDAHSGPSGRYLAVWKKVVGQWVIESELYVTLAHGQ